MEQILFLLLLLIPPVLCYLVVYKILKRLLKIEDRTKALIVTMLFLVIATMLLGVLVIMIPGGPARLYLPWTDCEYYLHVAKQTASTDDYVVGARISTLICKVTVLIERAWIFLGIIATILSLVLSNISISTKEPKGKKKKPWSHESQES